MKNIKQREQEQAYLLMTDQAEVIEDLVSRDSFGEFVLGVPEVHNIVDTYLDTKASDLRLSTVSLRKREIDGKTLLTFKGAEKPESKLTQDHSEWEFEWPFDLEVVDPHILFQAAGLQEVQKRETTRVSRGVYFEDEVVAEMNVDSSLYTVSTGQARLYELEFAREGKAKFKPLLTSVEEELGKLLIPWQHGKFTTGKAIEFAFGIGVDDNLKVTPESVFYLTKMFEELVVK